MIHLLLLKADLDTWRGEMWKFNGVDVLDIPWWQTERQGSYGKKYDNINKHKQTSTNKSKFFIQVVPSQASRWRIDPDHQPWRLSWFLSPTNRARDIPGSTDLIHFFCAATESWKVSALASWPPLPSTLCAWVVRVDSRELRGVKMDKFGADPVYQSYI